MSNELLKMVHVKRSLLLLLLLLQDVPVTQRKGERLISLGSDSLTSAFFCLSL